MLSFIYRCWAYFRRGHGVYLALAVSLVNFLTIQYNFLVLESHFLKSVFQDILVFGLTFLPFYVILAVIFGWLDMRKGAMAAEQQVNPWIRDTIVYNGLIVDALFLMSEGQRFEAQEKLSEARRVMGRWEPRHTSS